MAKNNYDAFAKHYDVLMGDRAEIAEQIRPLLKKHAPKAKTLLELGCGTGSVLRHFSKTYDVSGLDLSAEMLRLARRKLPNVALYHQDMSRFELNRKFDVVLCIFDSINHLMEFAAWKRVFKKVSAHLNPGGVFIFDINTLHKLQTYSSEPPFAEFHKNGICIFEAQHEGRGRYFFQLRLLRRKGKNQFELFETRVPELGVPTHKVVQALKKQFVSVKVWDPERAHASAKSEELYFVCKAP